MVPERIEREILIDAPLETVWAIVTEPQHVGTWFSNSAEIDLRPGGKATLVHSPFAFPKGTTPDPTTTTAEGTTTATTTSPDTTTVPP